MLLRIFFLLSVFSWWTSPVLGARINLFLNITEAPAETTKLFLKEVTLLGEAGKITFKIRRDLPSSAVFGQYFLGSQKVRPGQYQNLKIKLSKETLKTDLNFSVRREESLSIFLLWNAKLSRKEGHPILSARLQRRPLGEDTIYVSCEDLDTVFAVRTDLNQVQASVGIPGKPQDLALTKDGRLYVLASQKRSLYLVETGSFRVMDRFLLPLLSAPRYLILLPGAKAVISDPQAQYVIKVDLTSGELLSSRRIGHQPLEMFYDPRERLLYVSSPLDQAIYVLNEDLSPQRRFAIQSPRGLLVSDSLLYVAEYSPGLVAIFDLATGRLKNSIRSGRGTLHLFRVGRRLFITNEKEGSLTILREGQSGISKKIFIGGRPFTLTSCSRRRWLYVANRKGRSLTVIDLTSEKKVGEVELGGTPFGLSSILEKGDSGCLSPNYPVFGPSSF